jgi:hypothetical protein
VSDQRARDLERRALSCPEAAEALMAARCRLGRHRVSVGFHSAAHRRVLVETLGRWTEAGLPFPGLHQPPAGYAAEVDRGGLATRVDGENVWASVPCPVCLAGVEFEISLLDLRR